MSKSGVFISYARRDGEAAARSLRDRLARSAPDLRIWQDRPEIEGGVGWWRQIEDALERVEFLVIVMTPAVLESEVTRREWRAARQSGVAVYPVKGPDFDPACADVPRWMAKVHCYDLEVQWETFIAHLRRGAQSMRVPFMAPPLPVDFVPRPGEFETLKRQLLTAEHGDPISVTVALLGGGGFGKTTLAAALCHDDDVLAAFDDGVLWATLGQTPNVQGELTRLYGACTGERPSFISTEDAAQALAEKIATRNCLLVVDDVWDPAHMKPFCRGGPGCARLITTRQSLVAADAKRIDIDEMRPAEAVALLVGRLPERPRSLEPFKRLADRLGEWPLLLKLVGGAMRQRIERGDSVAGALDYVLKALVRRGVTAFDRESAADRHAAVGSTIDIGLEQLAPEDRERCLELAIFPEDVEIPLAVVGELWDRDAFDTEETLIRLDGASLIEFDLKGGTIGLHDVMRAYFRLRLPAGGASAHGALLDAWRTAYDLPHSYAWRWILHHLHGARRDAEIEKLLTDVSWLAAKLAATDVHSLLDDYRRVSSNPALDTIANAIRLSSHTLSRDGSQLVPQLLARLSEIPAAVAGSLKRAADSKRAWLRPIVPSLTGPGGALVLTLNSPCASIAELVVSAAADCIYAVTDNGKVLAWHVESGTELRGPELRTCAGVEHEHADPVRTIAAMPDGRLVLGTPSGFAIWDPQPGATCSGVVPVAQGVFSMAVSAARNVVIGTKSGAISVWSADQRRCLAELPGHRRAVVCIAVTADGRICLTGGYDKTARLLNLETGEMVETLHGLHEGVIYAVALSHDGKLALTGAADGGVRVWDLPAATLRTTLLGHRHRVYAVALSADNRQVLSGSHDRTVKLWDLDSGQLLRTYYGHADAVHTVAFMPDGLRAVSGGGDGSVRLWRLDAGATRAGTQEHEGWIHAVALAPDASVAATGGQDRIIRLWNPRSGERTAELTGHGATVSALTLDLARQRIVSASHDGKVRVWDLSRNESVETRGSGEAIAVITVTNNGTRALSGTLDGTAMLWNLERMRLEQRWDAHRRAITLVATTRHGRIAVTGSIDGTLTIWDVRRLKPFLSIAGHADGITAGALSSETGHLLTGGGDGTLRLWSFPKCSALATINAHRGRTRSIQILPAAGLAVTAGYDHYVKVWRFPELELVATFATDSAVAAVAASDDGRILCAGDAQGCAHFLALENCELS